MAQTARAALETRRGSFTTWFTFLVGIPLGVGALYLIEYGPWQDATIQRYVHHEAEQAVVVIFFCCLAAFFAKFCTSTNERIVHAQTLLPKWDGKPVAATEVTQLQQPGGERDWRDALGEQGRGAEALLVDDRRGVWRAHGGGGRAPVEGGEGGGQTEACRARGGGARAPHEQPDGRGRAELQGSGGPAAARRHAQ